MGARSARKGLSSSARGRSRFTFLERFDIADVANADDTYLRRWYLIETPWFGIKLHHILRADADRALHDHPWSFVSLILRGGYTEERPLEHVSSPGFPWLVERIRRRPGRLHRVRADELHRIDELHGSCWTLVVNGPKRRTWGFSEGPGEWTAWDLYLGLEQP